MERSQRYRTLWWWLPAVVFVALLWPKIDAGTLWHHDELLTANRAREMIVRGDPGTLTLNFAPDFRKPPLQYWLCALTLRVLPDQPELAVRLPSLLGGAACLLAVAWLAQAAYSKDGPVTPRLAVLALMGCGYFILMSRLGLLDTGAALWLTLALAGCQRARSDPRWWWFVGGMCVVGAWQKAPYAFAAWLVVLVVRACSASGPPDTDNAHAHRRRPHLVGALLASLLLAATWWLLQVACHGPDAVYASIWRQARAMTYAHHPEDTGFRPYLYWFWLTRDWGIPGLCAPLAVLAAVWPRRRNKTSASVLLAAPRSSVSADPTTELGWVCAIYLLALAVTPFRVERYLVVIMPLLALLSMRWLSTLPDHLRLPLSWNTRVVRRWLLIATLATTLPTAFYHFFKRPTSWSGLRDAAIILGRDIPPGGSILAVTEADPNFLVPGFLAFYGNLRGPWRGIPLSQIGSIPPLCRGLCLQEQWPEVVRQCPEAYQLTARDGWIVWARPKG